MPRTCLAPLCGALLRLVSFPAIAASPVQLIDDLGKPIAGPVEICVQVGTESRCSSVVQGRVSDLPQDLATLRIEGPDHGPVTVPAGELRPKTKGEIQVVVPRKADLVILSKDPPSVTVSLYPVDDPTFRRPAWRQTVSAGARVKIPAGDFLASLSVANSAPDLQLLPAKPGTRHRRTFLRRQGWSLLLRVRAEEANRLQPGATATVVGAGGFSVPGSRPRSTISAENGLAVVSGIEHVLASASIVHPRFVPAREEGLSAAPGTFAFREVSLERGASLRAIVTEKDRPVEGAACQVLAYAAKPLGPTPEPELLAQAETDLAGTCRATALAPGQYTLRIRIAGSRSWLDRPISLLAGEELQIDVALASITVTGTAKQGSEPLSGFAVSFVDLDDIKPNATRRDAPAEAVTEEDGSYETVLRAPGNYAVSLLAANGAPAASQRLWLGAAEETVDFSLEEYGVGGIVVDDAEHPVEGATLMLGWNGYYRVAHTDSKGAFLFPLSDAGAGRLQASKPGYLAPPPVDVSSKPGEPPPPLVLRMKRAGVLKGTVVAHGPAAGASLRSTRLEPGGAMTFLGLARADASGRFEIPASETGMTRVFVTGAGCPLTTFDFLPTGNEVEVQCPEQPASVALYFSDTRGLPVAGKSVLLRRGGVVVPIEMLSEHLAGLRLSAASDANGRLLLVALAPGAYDFFLTDLTNTALIAQGNPRGLLASSQLDPFSTTEIQVTIESAP